METARGSSVYACCVYLGKFLFACLLVVEKDWKGQGRIGRAEAETMVGVRKKANSHL